MAHWIILELLFSVYLLVKTKANTSDISDDDCLVIDKWMDGWMETLVSQHEMAH